MIDVTGPHRQSRLRVENAYLKSSMSWFGRTNGRRIGAAFQREGNNIDEKTVRRPIGEQRLKSYVRVKKYHSGKGAVGRFAPTDILQGRLETQHPNET